MKIKAIILIFVTIMILFISGCIGKIEVSDFNYPPKFNTITGRVVSMNLVLKNIGNEDCIIKKVYSKEFWNEENPGLSGMYSKNLNLILSKNQEYTIEIDPYLWDSDLLKSKDKNFKMYIEVDNPEKCILEETTLSGKIEIIATEELLDKQANQYNTVVYDGINN